ncbi:hypothetical protein GGI02_002543 [Coemansia sp. RSA 2322]|nr:hypothetical protein GGI02_002543 [Coemansia sp. RSA 2322]
MEHTVGSEGEQAGQFVAGLDVADLDMAGFQYPLGDQASVFNFHAAGLGLSPMYMGTLGWMGGVAQQAGSIAGIAQLDGSIAGIAQLDGNHLGTRSLFGEPNMAAAAAAGSAHAPAARIDQACRMCRQRKVRCDGARPACGFCQTKRAECRYEPATEPKSRKRRRRRQQQRGGDEESVVSLAARVAAEKAAAEGAGAGAGALSSSSDSSGSDESGESASEGEGAGHGGLGALSRQQIAAGGVDDQGDPDCGRAEGAGDPDYGRLRGLGTRQLAALDETPRLVAQYFACFHAQWPILHRATFERAVRDASAAAALVLAVLAIGARYAPGRGAPRERGRAYAAAGRALLGASAALAHVQAAFLLGEHAFGVGDALHGTALWGTAARLFNQRQLHLGDEAFQLPAYTSHLGLHESAISRVTCRQSPAHHGAAARRADAGGDGAWVAREQQRRMRWALVDAERLHGLAAGAPPVVTLAAGWAHMPCSDALWASPRPRAAAEAERLLLHMGRYYVDSGGTLRTETYDSGSPGSPPLEPNRVAALLVRVRRRRNRMHLRAHSAVVVAQLARARLALFRDFFPSRWPSQLGEESAAPAPWDVRLRRLRAATADADAKLALCRVYLEAMFPPRGADDDGAYSPDRAEYANHRMLRATRHAHARAVVLQLHACLERRAHLPPPAKPFLRMPSHPPRHAMRALRADARDAWAATVRHACEVADLLASHWLAAAPADPARRLFLPAAASAACRLNRALLDALARAPAADAGAPAELPLACSMNSNIRIETNAEDRPHAPPSESDDDAPLDLLPTMEPFRRQMPGSAYFIFVAAKTLIMYLHHAHQSAHARPPPCKSSVSDADADALSDDDFADLAPPPELRSPADVRRMQDRLEILMNALRLAQRYWMPVDYYTLCARKLRNMALTWP